MFVSQYQPPLHFMLKGHLSVPNSEKGNIKKMSVWGDLKSSCHRYLPDIYYVPFQKRLGKIKYGFEGSISNVDLGLF